MVDGRLFRSCSIIYDCWQLPPLHLYPTCCDLIHLEGEMLGELYLHCHQRHQWKRAHVPHLYAVPMLLLFSLLAEQHNFTFLKAKWALNATIAKLNMCAIQTLKMMMIVPGPLASSEKLCVMSRIHYKPCKRHWKMHHEVHSSQTTKWPMTSWALNRLKAVNISWLKEVLALKHAIYTLVTVSRKGNTASPSSQVSIYSDISICLHWICTKQYFINLSFQPVDFKIENYGCSESSYICYFICSYKGSCRAFSL